MCVWERATCPSAEEPAKGEGGRLQGASQGMWTLAEPPQGAARRGAWREGGADAMGPGPRRALESPWPRIPWAEWVS